MTPYEQISLPTEPTHNTKTVGMFSIFGQRVSLATFAIKVVRTCPVRKCTRFTTPAIVDQVYASAQADYDHNENESVKLLTDLYYNII